ncbi:MAG: hypothetical protein HY070_13060, partial [Chloroflexi bacterium]|nr:hypothetical protein [Chloroflexota bacterium]
MTAAEMERRFFELKGKLQVDALTEAEFRGEMQKLQFRDASGKWWMIGAQSGQWYGFDGTRWVPGTPPPETNAAAENFSGQTPESVTQVLQRANFTRDDSTENFRPDPALALRARAARLETLASRPRRNFFPILLIGGAIVLIALLIGGAWFVSTNVLGRATTPAPSARATNSTANSNLPANFNALIAMGDKLLLASQLDAAITQYESAIKLAPTNSNALTRAARALAYRGQIQASLDNARKATQAAPNDSDAHAQLARALLWSGQVDQAISAGEKAVALDSKNVNAYAAVAEAYLHAKRAPDAQKAALAALEFGATNADAHRAQAWVLTLGGQKEAALTEWNKTVSLEPNFFFRHFELAEVERIFFNLPVDAVGEYQLAIQLYGAYIPTISRLGFALLDANRAPEAATQLLRALTLDANNAEIAANLGVAFQRQNKCSQAIPYFEFALKLDANNSLAQRGLSDCKSGKSSPASAPLAPSV